MKTLSKTILAAGVVLSGSAFGQTTGPSSSASPYLVPTAPNITTTSILTTGDVSPRVGGGNYIMAGIPDGLGAFDNNDGTFTVLMDHEISSGGVARAHGGTGAFVSEYIINKSNFSVVSGQDLMQTVLTEAGVAVTGSALNFSRFCSADLAAPSAFFNSASGLGSTARIFLNGEENGSGGRAMAHVATGASAHTSYVLTGFGGASWENLLASPNSGDSTVVIGNDDSGGGKIKVYIGTKQSTGTEIQKAGLAGVSGFNIQVGAVTAETRTGDIGIGKGGSTAFTLTTGAGTGFLRPEDGAWDTLNANRYYFVTTDQYDQVKDGVGAQVGRSRLWALDFTDVKTATAGGNIKLLLDGTEAQQMFDNISVDKVTGHLTMLEDVGNQAHNGKVFDYDPTTGTLTQILQHDPARFGNIGVPATSPFTQDEESSGVIDISDIVGSTSPFDRTYLLDVQAHYATGDPNTVEGGQLLAVHAVPEPSAVLSVLTGAAMLLGFRRRKMA